MSKKAIVFENEGERDLIFVIAKVLGYKVSTERNADPNVLDCKDRKMDV
jgi:hypothetical protein